jgi:HIP---CoA ligase
VVPKLSVSEEDLIAWCGDRMAGFKAPRYVEFLNELPLNATGKVMKDQLR